MDKYLLNTLINQANSKRLYMLGIIKQGEPTKLTLSIGENNSSDLTAMGSIDTPISHPPTQNDGYRIVTVHS